MPPWDVSSRLTLCLHPLGYQHVNHLTKAAEEGYVLVGFRIRVVRVVGLAENDRAYMVQLKQNAKLTLNLSIDVNNPQQDSRDRRMQEIMVANKPQTCCYSMAVI